MSSTDAVARDHHRRTTCCHIVNDDEVNILLLDQLFATQPEWNLAIAMSGAAGLAQAVRQRPDFILLDLTLPDMSGWEVLKRLKADRRTRDIPVIAVSADAMPKRQQRTRALGLADYWTKPLDLPATVAKLKTLCALVSRCWGDLSSAETLKVND